LSSVAREQMIYSSGIWQFEGYGYIPRGTTGASVMQIFGAAEHATTLMLHVYDGRLTYYHDDSRVVDASIYDRWFKLNVIHDVDVQRDSVRGRPAPVDGARPRRGLALLQVRRVRAAQ
jgi:hypothetical protein